MSEWGKMTKKGGGDPEDCTVQIREDEGRTVENKKPAGWDIHDRKTISKRKRHNQGKDLG